jgi:hypothetical protein
MLDPTRTLDQIVCTFLQSQNENAFVILTINWLVFNVNRSIEIKILNTINVEIVTFTLTLIVVTSHHRHVYIYYIPLSYKGNMYLILYLKNLSLHTRIELSFGVSCRYTPGSQIIVQMQHFIGQNHLIKYSNIKVNGNIYTN